jgi:hypothetical protein
MLRTPSVMEIPNDIDGLFSFAIRGEVGSEDMREMSEFMLRRFEEWDKVDMLLVFAGYDGAEAGASLDADAIRARFKSLTNVRNYVTAGAPEAAGTMIEILSKIMPVNGRAFDTEAEAMAFLRAQPPLRRAAA